MSRRKAFNSSAGTLATSTNLPSLRKRISPAVGLQRAQNQSPGGRLATARFTHQPQGFAFKNGKIDAIHGAHMPHRFAEKAFADGEIFFQIVDFKQGLWV